MSSSACSVCSFFLPLGSAANGSFCGRSDRWYGPPRASAAAICGRARPTNRGWRSSSHSRPRSTIWPRKLAAREEELKIANQHLEELASLDGLTGLANRRGFDRELDHAWHHADELREPLALIMIDIDHFKLFNDRYGHVQGDACLRAVGETLSLVALDKALIVARYGGEEFALLLPGLDIEHALALAEEARRSIGELLMTHAESPCGIVTISIGVESRVPEGGQSAACLVEAADRALYDAKRRGRNTVVAHSPLLLSSAS